MCVHSFFTRTQEPYSSLLEKREWGAKRVAILARDNYTCTHCGAKEGLGVQLHVHHKHYIYGLDPWEYKDTELVTLCEKCHSELHQNSKVPVYCLQDGQLVEIELTPCHRCNGAGWFPQYKHVQGGICFRCYGAKYEELIHVVENYAEEHNISLEDICDGFNVLDPNIEKLGTIVEARVQKYANRDNYYCQLVFNNGRISNQYLDFSMMVEQGDRLDPQKLRYRTAVRKNGTPYIIIKGTPL